MKHTRIVFVSFYHYVPLKRELSFIGKHLKNGISRILDKRLRPSNLILAAPALGEILALHSLVISKFGIRSNDLYEIGQTMQAIIGVNAAFYAFSWKGEGYNDHPGPCTFLVCLGQALT